MVKQTLVSYLLVTMIATSVQLLQTTKRNRLQMSKTLQTIIKRKHAGYALFKRRQDTGDLFLVLKPKWDLQEWILPEGVMNEGETISQTAQRILKGITGYTIGETMDVQSEVFRPDNVTSYLLAILINDLKPIKLSSYYAEYRWLKVCDAKKILDWAGRKVLDEADKLIKQFGYKLMYYFGDINMVTSDIGGITW